MNNKTHFKGEFSAENLERLKEKIGSSDENCYYDVRAKTGEKVETIIDRTDDTNKLDDIDLDDTVECYILNWYHKESRNPKERHFLYTYPDAMSKGLGNLSPVDAVSKQVAEQVDAFKKEFTIDQQKKAIKELEDKIIQERKAHDKELESIKEEVSELEKMVEKYQAGEDDEAKMQRMTQLGALALGTFTRVNPVLGQKIEKSLGGLLGLPVEQPQAEQEPQQPSQSLSEADINAMSIGNELLKAFPEPYIGALWTKVIRPLAKDFSKIDDISDLLNDNENENTANY